MDIFCCNAYVFVGGHSEVRAFRLRGCAQTPCHFQRGQEYYGEMDVIAGTALIFGFLYKATYAGHSFKCQSLELE